MRKLIFIMAAFLSLVTANVSAQGLYQYQSKENGLQIVFPGEANIGEDSNDGLTLEGDDYIFMAMPFDPQTVSKDELTAAYAKIIESSKVDMSTAEQREFESKTLVGAAYLGSNEVSLSISGIVYSKVAPDKVGFIFIMMSSHDKVQTALQAVNSLEFYPEMIQ